MFTSNEEIIITIILSTSLILFFAVFVVIAVRKYHDKQKEFLERENTMKSELIKATLEAKEQTLKDLAQRIHVDIQQSLSLVKLNLNKVLLHPDKISIDKILQSKELIIKTIEEVKGLSKELDPKYITGYTLEENIIRQLDRVEKRTDIVTLFKTSKNEIVLDNERLILLYRIIQEAINNILAHAEATKVEVSLKNNLNDFILTIEDNGKGFEVVPVINEEEHSKRGIGLMNMQSRTQLINGTFTMKSKPNNGTKITLKIPYNV